MRFFSRVLLQNDQLRKTMTLLTLDGKQISLIYRGEMSANNKNTPITIIVSAVLFVIAVVALLISAFLTPWIPKI